MFKSHQQLTAAVLLSCACLMAPFYAHAEEGITINSDGTISSAVNVSEDNGVAVSVEGQGTNVIIDADITSSGANGKGIYVSTNLGQSLTLNAGKTVQALGKDGIAVFFGNNDGEIAVQNDDGSSEYSPENNFNVSGNIKGQQAAIYISQIANLDNINILSGASIKGSIIHEGIFATNLTFGGKYNKEGNSSNGSHYDDIDPSFNLSYGDGITGPINMHIAGGTLEYNGTAEVSSVIINKGATLSGAGTYKLSEQIAAALAYNDGATIPRGTFTNDGIFELGDGIKTISIDGNYIQGTNGNLLVDFNSDAGSDVLKITNGSAQLAGKITLTPQVDYYFNGQTIKLKPIIQDSNENALTVDPIIPKINNISPVLIFTVAGNNTKVYSNGEIVEVVDGQTPDCNYGATKYVIKVSRVDQGYQNVADDTISAGIGSAIDNESGKMKDETYIMSADKKALLTALDNPILTTSSLDEWKVKVNSNLKKLNPNVVGSQSQAVLETHTTLNNLVSVTSLVNAGSMSMNAPVAVKRGGLGPTKVEPPKYNSWRNIVIPFAAYTNQHNGSNGYTNHNSGVIGAMERTFANGLTHGYHAAINHQSTEDSGSTIKGEGLYLGTHASYAPEEWNGWSVFSSARLGVEQMRSHRRVYIPSAVPYIGTADGDWTGYSGSFNIGAALTKEHGIMRSGPFAALDYSFAHRPSVHEDGGAVRTNLESATYDSMRTQLGYRLVTNPKALHSYDSTQWQAHASVAWNHELLSDNGRTNYQLVEFPGATVEDDIETYGRDSMSIAAGVIFKTPNRLDVGLTLGSDIYRKGGSSVYGKVNFEWKF